MNATVDLFVWFDVVTCQKIVFWLDLLQRIWSFLRPWSLSWYCLKKDICSRFGGRCAASLQPAKKSNPPMNKTKPSIVWEKTNIEDLLNRLCYLSMTDREKIWQRTAWFCFTCFLTECSKMWCLPDRIVGEFLPLCMSERDLMYEWGHWFLIKKQIYTDLDFWSTAHYCIRISLW